MTGATSLLVKGCAAHEYPMSRAMLSMPIPALLEGLIGVSATWCALIWWVYILGR